MRISIISSAILYREGMQESFCKMFITDDMEQAHTYFQGNSHIPDESFINSCYKNLGGRGKGREGSSLLFFCLFVLHSFAG